METTARHQGCKWPDEPHTCTYFCEEEGCGMAVGDDEVRGDEIKCFRHRKDSPYYSECATCFHPRSVHYGGEDGSCMDVDSEDVECSCKWFDVGPVPEHPSDPDQLTAQARGICWHSPTSDRWPCQMPLADWEIELL